ncbi:MAG: asparaginase [Hydrogenophaga sp.]|nr:asparaginase [Hydrogenophaga sp.]
MNAAALPHHVPLTVALRGGHPENIHYGSLAVVDAQGQLLASVGDVDSPLFTRSALKPFQAMPLIACSAERDALEDADIALLCASHSGEPMHVERVAALLARIGAGEAELACGSHVPFFFAANGQSPAPGAVFTRLHHNCSGKHTGMLMLAHALGQPLAGYLAPQHPVQEAIAASVSHFTGMPVDQLVRGTDGCSAPNHAVPLRALAHAFARLTMEQPDAVYGTAPIRTARAMSRHPELVSGQGRNDLALMRAGRGDWVSKVGADGVQAIASFSRGIAIAAKVSDGGLAPLMVAVVSALDQLGWLDAEHRKALASLIPPPLKNAAGIEVGEMQAVLKLG